MIIDEMLEECPDCRKKYPLCKEKFKVMEIYAGFEPIEFDVEKYVYWCKRCGRTVKRLRSLSPKIPDKYIEINFEEI